MIDLDVFDIEDERYAAQVMPEVYPAQPKPRLENWSEEDREMFCGIYTEERRQELREVWVLYLLEG